MKNALAALLLVQVCALLGCDPEPTLIHSFANRCVAIRLEDPGASFPLELAVSESGDGYDFARVWQRRATPFFLKPSGLATYLLFDDEGSYAVSDGADVLRAAELMSDVLLIDDSYESEAEWVLEHASEIDPRQLRFRHKRSGRYLATQGLVDSPDAAARVEMYNRDGCAEFPEATLDADGRVKTRRFRDGSVFGVVDTHSHLLSNFGFGGGGIYHGSTFHPLGIEHALSDCAVYHGEEGRKDLFGFGFDNQGSSTNDLLASFLFGQTPEPNHVTAGYPEFTDWPNAHTSSTHQVQYYKWLERAYLGGLRLVVQHATTNQIICDFIKGAEVQETRYACNDMVAVERIIEETYNMEAYIDAQEGGPGEGWFRIVTSPSQARRVIRNGKMAVVLGIETSNLFDCFLVPSAEFPSCTEQDVIETLDRYHDLGVRVMFPVHKFDNGFSAGDGDKLFIELGNFIQTGHFGNFTTDCDPTIPTVFDKGTVFFDSLNEPRDDYFAPPPNDMTNFPNAPIATLAPFLQALLDPPGTEQVCQNAGLTQLGEFLLEQMMLRGMMIELDHLPRRSYKRAFEILEQNDYPPVGTHGINNNGAVYRLGGVSKAGFGRCRNPNVPATTDDGFQNRIALIEDNGGYPAEGFGFDLNGFAGAPGPRFGPNSVCGNTPQEDPITYPFTSYAGDVTFTQPHLGNRVLDFNTEGMAHIGLMPELIEEVRRDGVTDAELEPLFRSAEGYLRMWKKAEVQGRRMRAEKAD